MASLSLHCISSKPMLSYLNADEQQSHLGCTQSFFHEVHSKPPKRQMTQASLTANLNYNKNGNRVSSLPIIAITKEEACCYKRENEKINTKQVVDKEAVSPEKLDEWMRDSVVEIVKDIGKAPFLVHVYSEEGIGSSPTIRMRLEREKVMVESWPLVKRRWEEGKPIPDGVILVEELKDEEDGMSVKQEKSSCSELPSATKTWGLLIQGRGVSSAACYILKTCRVWSPSGFCTHFYLVRAKCFGDAAELQFKSSWLQGQRTKGFHG